MIVKKTPRQVQEMLAAGQVLAEVVEALHQAVVPGVRIKELDELAEALIRERGGRPSFLGYRGFPGSICASPNDVVVHGIPDGRRLVDGDIFSADVGLVLDGWHADTAATFAVGEIDPQARRLLEVTEAALEAGVRQCRPGNRLSDISHAVQTVVEEAGFSVVREFVGHGIGRQLHEDPAIPNFGPAGRGPALEPGMVFAIEPMVNLGDWGTRTLADGWTVVTADGSLSAHFEHTVAVTPVGPQVLTRLRQDRKNALAQR
ncbi:MAG: type I methionyl aminopeptidase [Actinomycetota bacterium]